MRVNTNFKSRIAVKVLASALMLWVCAAAVCAETGTASAGGQLSLEQLNARISRYTPVEITAPVNKLSRQDRRVLDKILEAAKIMDPLFLRQAWAGNEALLQKLEKDKTPRGKAELLYFRINVSPWSKLDQNEPFLPFVPPAKPPQGNYYPEDLTKVEFENWAKSLSPADKEKAIGFFHLVRRRGGTGENARELILVPYSKAYREFLDPSAKLLREAAALTTNSSLKNFLSLRADAFFSDDYYASDVAWMELDAPIDVTIGPYETYDDELLNYKAAFEAFVTIRDAEESAKVAKFSSCLQEIENNLPMKPEYRNPKIAGMSPIVVVDEVFCSGNANYGVQTAAYNLPNDERIIREKGSKRIMLKNVQECKFRKILVPLAETVLSPANVKEVKFEAFFTHILMHELSHGIGPTKLTINGRETTPRQELKELYPAIEEAKADITGLFAMQYLIDKGLIPKEIERAMYSTFLTTSFRAVRFGINEAHGKGFAMIFNSLVDGGAVVLDQASGTFSADSAKMKIATKELCGKLLTLEAEGNYAGAKDLLDKMAVIREPMRKALAKLTKVPVDIYPIFKQVE